MTISIEANLPSATGVAVDDATLSVALSDGRVVAAPLSWFPRLLHATPDERADWRLVGQGEGLHWPQLDEDISVESLILGRPSAESALSLGRWLASRRAP